MPPRLPTASLRSLSLIRSYATQKPPAPFTTAVADATTTPIAHSGSTSPLSESSSSSSTDVTRVYPIRKQFLTEYYTHLLSTSPLFLLLEYDNVSMADWNKIRTALKNIPPPPQPASTSKTKKRQAQVDTSMKLVVVRTGVFGAVARKTQSPEHSLSPWLTGQRAVLRSAHLSPPYLGQVLKAINKAVKQCRRDGDVKQPMVNVVVGLVDGKLAGSKDIAEMAKLPDLQTLRAQLLGSLESPGRSVLGVLSAAGGGQLVRTLQGLEISMKEESGEGGPPGDEGTSS